MMEVWGEGSTWEELQASIEACPAAMRDPWLRPGIKFRIVVETYGCRLGTEHQRESIQRLAFIPFKGSVDLKHPDVKLWLLISGAQAASNSGVPAVSGGGREGERLGKGA